MLPLSFMKIDFSAWKFLIPRLMRSPQKLEDYSFISSHSGGRRRSAGHSLQHS